MSTLQLSETLGWVLIHSLWQAAITLILSGLLTRISKKAQNRYLVNCVAMAIVLATSVATFLLLNEENGRAGTDINTSQFLQGNVVHNGPAIENFGYLSFFNQYTRWIVWIWITGMFVFTTRLILGYVHIAKLRRSAILIEQQWQDILINLADRLQLQSIVQLAESKVVSVPVALGFLKPIILVPTGMLTGLSIAEIESIFIHELAHIKRDDFIINVAQCVIEIVFFFNPFVWLISQRVRKEREYCCDDIVMGMNVNEYHYSNALIKVAEFQNQQLLALSATGNKNELFNRIKRIMEKSTSTSAKWNKLAPAILLCVGLLCASWITIRDFQTSTAKDNTIAGQDQDTLKAKNKKSAHYYQQSITSTDKDGEPYVETVEDFQGDTTLQNLMFPSITISLPDNFPDLPAIPDFNSDFDFTLQTLDTIPPVKLRSSDFEKFRKEFEENFQKHFGKFYEQHQDEFRKMMEDIQTDFQGKFNGEEWKDFQMKALADGLRFQEQAVAMKAQAESFKAMAEWQKAHADELKVKAEEMRLWQEANQDRLQLLQKKMQKLEKRMQLYQQRLQEELIKDGYLQKNEEIHNLQLQDDGSFEINGKHIKPSDQGKYKKLHDEMMAEEVSQ